jgi:thiol-disulfide isomerase/thioredoxin
MLVSLRAGYEVPQARVMPKDVASFYMDYGTNMAKSVDSFSNVTISGSAANADYKKLRESLKAYDPKMTALSKQYMDLRKVDDKAGMDKIEEEVDKLQADMKQEVYKPFLKNNPNSPVAIYALRQYAGYDINPEEIEPMYNQLAASIKNSPSAKTFYKEVDIAKKTAIGKYALEFTQNDTLGKPVSLSSLKVKYLLVDFWASWCGPCRAENPNVVKAFEKYKAKGFHILSVSLDQPGAKDKWINAIHDDGMPWTHVSDLKYWQNEVAQLYGIQAIPQNLLLDPSGKIVAKNLRGKTLDDKLAQFLN